MADRSDAGSPVASEVQETGPTPSPDRIELRDPWLVVDASMHAPALHAVAGGTAALFSTASPEHEGSNEDAACILPLGAERAVLAVADGLGGQRGGERASSLTLRTLRDTLQQTQPGGAELRDAILDGIETANRRVCELGIGAATTLVVVEVDAGRLRSYHVGDSLALVVGQRGRLKLQTISHSPVGYAVESGMLDEAEAMRHGERHLVSNLVGSAEMRIELGPGLELAPYDTLLLTTDGLADNLSLPEIVERIRKGSLRRAAERLAEDGLRRMSDAPKGLPSKADDLTFILFRLGRRRVRIAASARGAK